MAAAKEMKADAALEAALEESGELFILKEEQKMSQHFFFQSSSVKQEQQGRAATTTKANKEPWGGHTRAN